jgi:hypothetical protein
MSKREAARAALTNVKSLNPALHDEILDHMDAAGLFGDTIRASASSRIARVEAESATNPVIRSALRYAGGQLRQCGVSFDDIIDADRGEISLQKLNAAMEGREVAFRMGLKNALAAAKLID